MGRQLERSDSDIELKDYHPGCMWGILHILNHHHHHHHRHSLKKLYPRRKHGRQQRTVCCRNPKTISFDRFPDEVHEYLDADAVPLLVEQQKFEASPTNKLNGNAHIKASIAEEISTRAQLRQTDVVHHFEPSDHRLGTRSASWGNPIIILHKSIDNAASGLPVPTLPKASEKQVKYNSKNLLDDTGNNNSYAKLDQITTEHSFSQEKCNNLVNNSLSQNRSSVKQLKREISCPEFEYVDVLEIFKVNKKLFLDFQEDPDVQEMKQQSSKANPRLKKSGSFPLAASPFLRPSTLEHKQKEVWFSHNGEYLSNGVQPPKSVSSEFLKDSYLKSVVSKAHNPGGAAISKDTSSSPPALSHELDKHGWHQSFTSRIKYIKKKIKHVLREGRKENGHTSLNVQHDEAPAGSKVYNEEKDTPEKLEDITIDQSGIQIPEKIHDAKSFDTDLNKGGQAHIRRASSLNESVDRYARLFENTFSGEVKWHQYQSQSLKLTNEDKVPVSGYRRNSYRRRLSLPDLDSIYSCANESDVHNDLKSSSIPEDEEQFAPDAFEDAELQKEMVEMGKKGEINEHTGDVVISKDERTIKIVAVNEDVVELENLEQRPQQGQEVGSTIYISRKQDLDTFCQDERNNLSEFPVLESSQLDHRHLEEPDSAVTLQDKYDIDGDSFGGFNTTANCETVENANAQAENHILPFALIRLEDADFNYVRDVLLVSGFTEQDSLGKWHSLDHPLNPILFKELEAYLHQGCSLEDVHFSCNHRLLFDLTDEVLLEIYERSLAYFPKHFSFTAQHVQPLPKGNRVVDDVWKRINGYENTSLEEQTLDDIIGRDVAKGGGWMNLLFDAEDVALDLEDMIFDELLNEVLCR